MESTASKKPAVNTTSSIHKSAMTTPDQDGRRKELDEVRNLFPASMIQACNASFVQVLVIHVSRNPLAYSTYSGGHGASMDIRRAPFDGADEQAVGLDYPILGTQEDRTEVWVQSPGAKRRTWSQVNQRRTAHAKIQVRLQFPAGYPNTRLIVELKGDGLPQPFLRKLTKKAEDEASKHMTRPGPSNGQDPGAEAAKPSALRKDRHGDAADGVADADGSVAGTGGYQALAALRVVTEVVEKNKLLPCWKEMRQAGTLATSRGGECRIEESTGMITLRVKSGRYSLIAAIHIPDDYPMEGCSLELRSHNFPERIANLYVVQAREIVRRCLCGYGPELALAASNPISLPPARKGNKPGEGSVRITSDHMRTLKHDVEFIKKAHELRDVGECKGGAAKNSKVAPPSTQERRFARRELKTLAKSEADSEQEQARRMAELELREQEKLLHSQVANTSQPSLLPLVDLLVNVFGWRLPQETCVSCGKKVLPGDPRHPSLADGNHKDRPIRVFCGHWFHRDCLRVWMTEPPFGKDCPRCSRRVYHPDWPQTRQQLEKAWALQQAKRREIGEVRDFFTVDARFQAERRDDDFDAFT